MSNVPLRVCLHGIRSSLGLSGPRTTEPEFYATPSNKVAKRPKAVVPQPARDVEEVVWWALADRNVRRMKMAKAIKIGLLVVGALVVVTLLTLRVTGLEPPYVDPGSEQFVKSGRTTRPGFWLTGEVVHEPVTNWDWVNKVNDPIRKNTIMLETPTWYGIPHSVTINIIGRGDKLYVQGTERDFRLQKKFPYSKAWWANVERDPRVRMKIGGKIYEMTLVLIHDRAEVAQLQRGRDPVTKEIGADGKEHVTQVAHWWRVYQRNVSEYGNGSAVAASEKANSQAGRPSEGAAERPAERP
jgi:hypothetical protein